MRFPSRVSALLSQICCRQQSASPRAQLLPYVIVVWIALAFCSYRHVILDLLFQWQTNTSYSHGPVVIPIALWLLWHRRSTLPETSKPWIAGIGLLSAAHFLLCLGEYFYLPAIQRWSIPLWLSGMIGLLWGRRVLGWSMPGVCFLAFMIPVPFQLEMLANQSLQWASAWCSCLLLGLTSTFAVTDGYTLRMATGRVGITADCSGMRMTVAIAALCYVITFLNQQRSRGAHCADPVDTTRPRRFSDSVPGLALHLSVMMLLVIPAAILANAARISVMAFVMSRYRVETWTSWAHDLGDWFVLPVAAGLFLTLRAWLGRAICVCRSELKIRRSSQRGLYTRRRWSVRIGPILRISLVPLALAVLTGASIRHYYIQREHIVAEMMTAARDYEATADWPRAAARYRELVYLKPSAQEARYRHAWVSRQAATTLTERKQVFFQLETILNRTPFHVAALRTHLDLALELDMAVAAIRSAERLYSIERHDANTLQMCVEAMLRFPERFSGLPRLSTESLTQLVENLGPASQWRDNLVIELAEFCCRHADSVDSDLTDAIAPAVTKSANEVDSAYAHFQAWHFEHVFNKGASSLELSQIRIDDNCPNQVAYKIYLALAEEAWGGKKLDDAQQLLTKAISLIPTDYRGHAMLGNVCEAQADWSQCTAARLRAWRLAADRPLELGIKLAESLMRTECHPTITPLLESLAEDVNRPAIRRDKILQIRLHLVAAQLAMRSARHDEAVLKLERCRILAAGIEDQSEVPDRLLQIMETLHAQCLVQLGRFSDVARLFERRAGRVGSSTDDWTAAARAWRTADNASAAARCYRNAIFKLGQYSDVWLEYVHLLKDTSGIDEAADEVAFRHRRAHQDPPIADVILAQAWEIVEQSDRAIAHYRSAAKRNAHDVAALAIALARQGEVEAAIELVTDENWSVNTSIRAHTVAIVGVSAAHLSAASRATIMQIVEDGVAATSDDVTLLLAAGEWYTKCQESSVAIDLLLRAVAVQPANVVAANNLAMLLADERGDFEQALSYIENVLKQAGPVPEFLDTKGWILVQMNRAQEALPWLMKAAERSSSTDALAQLHLAMAYMAVGDRERAEEYFGAASAGRIRPELLSSGEQRAWATLQQEFTLQVLTQRDSGR